MNKRSKKEQAITLIALVVTIVVLLILAGVSISMLTGENGIIEKAKQSKEQTKIAEIQEKLSIAGYELKINKLNEVTLDDYLNYLKEKQIILRDEDIIKNTENEATIIVEGYKFIIIVENGNINIEVDLIGDVVEPSIEIVKYEKSNTYLFSLYAEIELSDSKTGLNFEKCKYVFTESNKSLGLDESLYTNEILQYDTVIEQVKPAGTYYLHILATDNAGNMVEKISEEAITIEETATYDSVGSHEVSLFAGKYQFECWGASGVSHNSTYKGGLGAYVSGNINLENNTDMYIYVGETLSDGKYDTETYNGGKMGFSSTANDVNKTQTIYPRRWSN